MSLLEIYFRILAWFYASLAVLIVALRGWNAVRRELRRWWMRRELAREVEAFLRMGAIFRPEDRP